MRIGVVSTSYPRSPEDPAGGFVRAHVRWLREAGHEVEVVAADHPAAIPEPQLYRVRTGSELFYGEGAPDRLARDSRYLVAAARFSVAMVRAVRRRSRYWDRAIAHWLAPSGVAAALVARRLPLLAISHSGDVHLLRRLRAAPAAARLFANHPRARLAFVSEPLRAAFLASASASALDRLAPRTAVIPMGVDVARFTRLRRPRSREGRRLLFLGRLVPVKGVDVLLDALTHVPGASLTIAGAGPEAIPLQRRAERLGLAARVSFAGELRGSARDQAIQSADLVAIPSVMVEGGRTEGMPQVLLEAMAAGVPVVASRVGGMTQAPVRLVEPANPVQLAAAIAALLTDRSEREYQLLAAEQQLRQFDWATIGPQLFCELERC